MKDKDTGLFDCVVIFFALLAFILLLTGCGHNVTRTDRGVGLMLRVPLPDGSSLVEFKVGKIDSVVAAVRGGSTFETTSATGGSLFGTAGTADRVSLTAIPQINEGYIKDILTSDTVAPDIKQALSDYLVSRDPPTTVPTNISVVGSGVATGEQVVQPMTTGLDRWWDSTTHVVTDSVSSIADTISDLGGEVMVAIIIIVLIIGLIIFWKT